MPKLLFLSLLIIAMSSCGSSNKAASNTSKTYTKERNAITANQAKANDIVKYATSFKGTPYRFGGTSRSGMDCSGLVYVSFDRQNIKLPRISRDMATQGTSLKLSQVAKGDLLFFKTNKNSNQINHVGLIVSSNNGDVKFIHATTSRGVIISSLDESYWNSAYVKARRLF